MHVVVVGAGAFGGWTALNLLRRGERVTLVDAFGPGNSKSSSGGETRIIRAMYGSDIASARFALRSMQLWREFEERWQTPLLYRTGFIVLAGKNDEFLRASIQTFRAHAIEAELLTKSEAAKRFPQIAFHGVEEVLYEPYAGILAARENCRTLLKHFVRAGGTFQLGAVTSEIPPGRLQSLQLANGATIRADQFVFACGPWLGKLFPDVIGNLVRSTRQEIMFCSVPPGDSRFSSDALPCWADRTHARRFYGIPDFQHRGMKIASDRRGPEFDPDADDRIINQESWPQAIAYLRLRLPDLAKGSLLESRVCQYENTPDLGFIIDRHPAADNLLLLGGGSGHGYKHGPAVGEYAADLVVSGASTEPCFSLSRFAAAQVHPISSF